MNTNNIDTLKRTLNVFLVCFLLGIVGLVGYALGSGVFHGSFVGNPTYTYSYAVEISDDTISPTDLLPGGIVSITPTITSKSTGNSYVFLRIECQSVDNNPIYSYEDQNGVWTVVRENPGEIIVAYGTGEACTTFAPDQEIEINGKLTLDITNAQYATLAEDTDPLKFTVHVCGIHSDAVGDAEAPTGLPIDIYQQYVNEGGV